MPRRCPEKCIRLCSSSAGPEASFNAVSCHTLSATLVLIGLGLQLGTVLWIVWSAGVGEWFRREIWPVVTGPVRRIIGRFRRRSVQIKAEPATATASLGQIEGLVVRPTDRPPPKSFADVGQLLNDIAATLNAHEKEFIARAEKHRDEVAEARADAARRHEEIAAAVDEEIRHRLLERRHEGLAIGAGVLFQFAGAAVLLFVC